MDEDEHSLFSATINDVKAEPNVDPLREERAFNEFILKEKENLMVENPYEKEKFARKV